ncbi:hypothetical protein HUU05_19280 [candidate division KSB1 bacterium]|nr:hypothetical protein [candidate division KSB1 bacterium]
MTHNYCENLNHRRPNAPVRFCPQCGAIVNMRILKQQCSEATHDKSRRNQNFFCVDCGVVLRKGAVPMAATRR